MDLPEAYERWPSFKDSLQSRGIETFCISAVKREGTHELVCAAYELLKTRKETNREVQGQNFVLISLLIFASIWSNGLKCCPLNDA